jgi:uncharacterized phage protein (TIGR01671 family)
MEQIRFRLRDIDTKKVFGYEHLIDNQWDYQYTGYDHNVAKWHTNSVVKAKKAIREQFIGLKDKNGKDIYEGDIINAKASKEMIEAFGIKKIKAGLVEWSDCGFFAGGLNPKVLEEIVIIGNKLENPELLKV